MLYLSNDSVYSFLAQLDFGLSSLLHGLALPTNSELDSMTFQHLYKKALSGYSVIHRTIMGASYSFNVQGNTVSTHPDDPSYR